MATYTEIRSLFSENSGLLGKVEVATIIAANGFLKSTPDVPQKAWAAKVFENPKSEAKKALMSVLAENNGLAVTAIQEASDSAIQNNVDAVAQSLVDANAGV